MEQKLTKTQEYLNKIMGVRLEDRCDHYPLQTKSLKTSECGECNGFDFDCPNYVFTYYQIDSEG